MQNIQCGDDSFFPRYFSILCWLISFWCLFFQVWLFVAQYSMGDRPLGLHLAGRGGIVPRATSSAHHELISSLAQYLSTFTYTSLSSGYLTSSGAAHGPIPISRPFIFTVFILNVWQKANFVRKEIKTKNKKFFTERTLN